MRCTDTCVLRGERTRLVPYRPEHVPMYNGWLQDDALLELTGSERQTLAEEYANCAAWHADEVRSAHCSRARALICMTRCARRRGSRS